MENFQFRGGAKAMNRQALNTHNLLLLFICASAAAGFILLPFDLQIRTPWTNRTGNVWCRVSFCIRTLDIYIFVSVLNDISTYRDTMVLQYITVVGREPTLQV